MLEGMAPLDELVRTSGQYGPKVEVDDADVQTRMLAFIGREPRRDRAPAAARLCPASQLWVMVDVPTSSSSRSPRRALGPLSSTAARTGRRRRPTRATASGRGGRVRATA
jgi:hypothetical protein